MRDKINIYVTLHELGLVNERIIGFLENFTFSLKRIVKSEYTVFIKGRDFTDSNFKNFSKQSDLFVFILDTNYGSNTEFQNELREICQEINFDSEDLPEFQNVFKVCLDAFDEKLLPESILPYINYTFYDINIRKKVSVPFDLDKESVKYWGKMLDLVYDLNESILFLDNPGGRIKTDFVYLGTCSPDQTVTRDDIKRELQHLGYRVLPLIELPADKEKFTAEVKKNVGKCQYVFQLIGQHYGAIPPGEKQSTQELENQLIREYLSIDLQKRRMVWIPVNQKLTDQKQDLFVNRIRRDDPGPNSEIIESNLNEFKNTIQLRLSTHSLISQPVHGENQSIYIISKPDVETKEIEQIITQNEIKAILPVDNMTKSNFKHHLEALNRADGLIICNYEEDSNWLISKIKDVIKAIGHGRNEKYKGICLISDFQPDLHEYAPWIPEINICKKNDVQSLIQFIHKIKG